MRATLILFGVILALYIQFGIEKPPYGNITTLNEVVQAIRHMTIWLASIIVVTVAMSIPDTEE